MIRKFMVAVLSAGLVATLAVAALAPIASGQEPIKIGLGFALTGDEAVLDVPASNGALLAIEEINAAGGVNGQTLEPVLRDSQYRDDIAAQVAKEFIEEAHVQIGLGYTDSNSVLNTGPTFQAAGIPFVTVGATSPLLPDQIGDMMFLAPFGDNVQAAAGAEYAAKNFGDTAYLLWDNGPEYTTLLAGYFKAAFEPLGEIVLEDQYADAETNFSAQIAKLNALPEQPDFYYIAAMPYNIGPIVKQMREAGLTNPIIGGDGYDDQGWLSTAGTASENVFFTTHALMDKDGGTEPIKKFMAAYEAKYGHPVENAFAALGYDTVYLVADAISRAASTDGAALKEALESTSGYMGITGSITLTPDAHVPQKGVTIIAVKDGKFTLGDEVIPEVVPAP